MRDVVDLRGVDAVDVAQEVGAVGAHDDEPFRQADQLVHGGALRRVRLAEDRVQRRHDRHAQLAQHGEHVASRGAAEDPVLVLDAEYVDAVDVEEIRGPTVRSDVGFGDLEPDARRIDVRPAGVVHRQHEAIERGQLGRDRVAEIGRERRDPAAPRQMVAQHGDLAERSDRRRLLGRVGSVGPRELATAVDGRRVGPQTHHADTRRADTTTFERCRE